MDIRVVYIIMYVGLSVGTKHFTHLPTSVKYTSHIILPILRGKPYAFLAIVDSLISSDSLD